tara:strand:- start:30664 stop:31209 length:546 start_codon:yes stop_codon:yes gene_type:complete
MSIISNYRNQNKQGLTLIEVLIGITIFGVLVAAVFGIYQTITASNDANEAGRNIQTIYNNTAKIFRRDTTDDLSTENATLLGIFPQGMNIVSDTEVYNVFDGQVELDQYTGPNSFILTYPEVPAGETCVSIVQGQIGVGWDFVDGETTDVDLNGQNAAGPGAIAATCDAVGDTLTLLFRKE